MKNGIKITVVDVDIDGPIVSYEMEVGNNTTHTWLNFYGNETIFKDFASKLESFNGTSSDKIYFHQGAEDESRGNSVALTVFAIEPTGRSVIEVHVENHSKIPFKKSCHFYISCDPGELNDLGKKLKTWNPLEQGEVEWAKK